MGEIVVFIAPVVGGASGDTGQLGCLFYSEAQLVGDEEGLFFEGYFRRVVANFTEICEVVVRVGVAVDGVFGLLRRVGRFEEKAAAATVEADLVAGGVSVASENAALAAGAGLGCGVCQGRLGLGRLGQGRLGLGRLGQAGWGSARWALTG